MNQTHYTIHGINGPVVKVTGGKGLAMMDMVSVGEEGLIGEVVSVDRSATTVQVYEDTAGLKPGQPVVSQGAPMAITLGPGMLTNIFDGIARPLKVIEAESGPFIGRGLNIPSLDQEKTWDVTLHVKAGDVLAPGALYASCPETPLIVHRCLVPAGVSGRVTKVAPAGAYRVSDTLVELTDDHGQIHPLALAQRWPIRTPRAGVSGRVTKVAPAGAYRVSDTLVELTDDHGQIHPLALAQRWPIRTPRPIAQRLPIDRPLVTGQRIIDTLFPIGKGGAAAIPGPFGAGKTMTQHQLAKWSDADIIVYLGCGERGNEMTQALEEFSELLDPKSQQPLMNRTILIANTSNMPVAAREASVYTGMTIAEYYRDMGYHVALMADSTSRWAEALREISGRLEEMPAEEGFYTGMTIAEYYRDMGYHVALMADSTSRWAEALREISGRLEEMPAEEGFPAYLASRLAEFYERAGYVKTLEGKEGSVTVIGAVSPQGGDFSEPVTQNTKRYVRTFWGLDRALAYARHFPSINWLTSYSEYADDLRPWYDEHAGPEFVTCRHQMAHLLQKESELMEIVKLIGADISEYADDLRPWYDEHAGPEFVTCRHQMAHLLQKESELMEIVKLIGADILPEDQKLIIETAKLFRVGFLQQNAYHAIDTYVPLDKQLRMMELMLKLYSGAKDIVSRAIPLSQLKETGIFESLAKMKYEVPNDGQEKFAEYDAAIEDALRQVNEANR